MKYLFTLPQIARILGLSRHAIYKWVKNGNLQAFQPSKNAAWKVTRQDLIKHMTEYNIPLSLLDAGKKRILIVDDDENYVKSIVRALKKPEYLTIEYAFTGLSAGIKLERFRPDVIILDIYLPDIDGRELFRHIKENPELNGVKVIGISAKLTENEIQPLLKEGFHGFLQKPFDTNELKEMILNID